VDGIAFTGAIGAGGLRSGRGWCVGADRSAAPCAFKDGKRVLAQAGL